VKIARGRGGQVDPPPPQSLGGMMGGLNTAALLADLGLDPPAQARRCRAAVNGAMRR
jgi:hypothetical protein